MSQLIKLLPRYLLTPPIFITIAVCLWLISAMLPYSIWHVCVSGRRAGLDCFPRQSSAFSLRLYDVSTHTSQMVVEPKPLTSMIKPSDNAKPKHKNQLYDSFDGLIRSIDDRLSEDHVTSGSIGSDHGDNDQLQSDIHDSIQSLTDATLSVEDQSTSLRSSFGDDHHDNQGDVNDNHGDREDNQDGGHDNDREDNQDDGHDNHGDREDNQDDGHDNDREDNQDDGHDNEGDDHDNEADDHEASDQNIGRNVTASDENTTTKSLLGDAADAEVEKMMQAIRKTAVPANGSRKDERWRLTKMIGNSSDRCDGRRVYVYELPSKFNTDLMLGCADIIPWFDMCEFMENSGMGRLISGSGDTDGVLLPERRWYGTHQYALEMVMHARIQKFTCLTREPSEASVFYVPYYGGLDVLRWHFRENATNEQRDKLTWELLALLRQQPWWSRHNGSDHVFVLGKISWDFRRYAVGGHWGSQLLSLPDTQNATKLLIERQSHHANDIGIPHPTSFHPRSDADVRAWQRHVSTSERHHLVSFAGKPRGKQSRAGSLRDALIRHCSLRNDSCFFLDCGQNQDATCLKPARLMSLFMSSEFCLQPPGDSPTRRSFFDSLVAGCIPVLFDPFSAYYQYPWHLPRDPSVFSVFVPADALLTDDGNSQPADALLSDDGNSQPVDVVSLLEQIPVATRAQMRQTIIEDILPGLLYADPGTRLEDFDDAFDITLNSLLWRITNTMWTSS